MFSYQKSFVNPTLPVDEAQFWALVRATQWAENIDKFRETEDHGVRHRRLPASRTAGSCPHLQHGVRYLTRRSDIRDALVESFLTRRQQHRRPLDLGRLLPKGRKNGQNKAFLFIILIELSCSGLFPYII